LVANGGKKIETRGRVTHYRGPLAIHAAKTSYRKESHGKINMWLYERRREDLVLSCFDLPFGEVVALVELVDCFPMTRDWIRALRETDPVEHRLGGYREGRYAWILKNIRPVSGVSVRGRQWLWELDRKTARKITKAAEVFV
jgi:hypothetical protein